MKNLFKLSLLMAALVIGFTACDKDDNDYSISKYWVSYGEIFDGTNGNNMYIVEDSGDTLNVVSVGGSFAIASGSRIWVNYTILSDFIKNGHTQYNVHINGIETVKSKLPIWDEFIDQDSVGHDKIDNIDAWFGMNKYLNIKFGYAYFDRTHMISLVALKAESTEDKVVVELRHNADGDVETYYGKGVFSFDIRSLVPEGKDHVDIELRWTARDGKKYTDNGTFRLTPQSITSASYNTNESIGLGKAQETVLNTLGENIATE